MAKSEKISRADLGIGKFTVLIFGALLSVVVYCGYKILPFYYYFFEIRNQIISFASHAADLRDNEIRQRIASHIKYLGIPANPESLIINRYQDTIRVVLEYEEEFYIRYKGKDYTIHVFPFRIDETVHY